jgi:hypothetical protein
LFAVRKCGEVRVNTTMRTANAMSIGIFAPTMKDRSAARARAA